MYFTKRKFCQLFKLGLHRQAGVSKLVSECIFGLCSEFLERQACGHGLICTVSHVLPNSGLDYWEVPQGSSCMTCSRD
jgi:hypothetical protein